MATEAQTSSSSQQLMRPDQAEVFARGLYWLADIDGIDDREVELIRAFLDEVGQRALLGSLAKGEFDATRAADVLETSFLRRVFLRTAIVLLQADRAISPEELEAIRSVAIAFDQQEHLEELLREAEGQTLD